jgi:hypothetical protein
MSEAPHTEPLARPEALLRVPVGFASPLWALFAGAAMTGSAWWWMTRFARVENLEAMFGAAETRVAEVVALAPPAVEALAEATVETFEEAQAAVEEVAEPVVEAAAEALVETETAVLEAAPEIVPEVVAEIVPEIMPEGLIETAPMAALDGLLDAEPPAAILEAVEATPAPINEEHDPITSVAEALAPVSEIEVAQAPLEAEAAVLRPKRKAPAPKLD